MKNELRLQSNLSGCAHGPAWKRLPFLLLVISVAFQSALAQPYRPPERPAVTPLIADRYSNDTDGDRIDDHLLQRAQAAMAEEQAATTTDEKSTAKAKATELVNVELIFKEPVTQEQIDKFPALGGEITYIYKAISYGWNARVPLNKVSAVPAAMGASLLLLDEPKGGDAQLSDLTRSGGPSMQENCGFTGLFKRNSA
jgi:hypothetical protein